MSHFRPSLRDLDLAETRNIFITESGIQYWRKLGTNWQMEVQRRRHTRAGLVVEEPMSNRSRWIIHTGSIRKTDCSEMSFDKYDYLGNSKIFNTTCHVRCLRRLLPVRASIVSIWLSCGTCWTIWISQSPC